MTYSCKRCGKTFEAKHNTAVCPECRVQSCIVCGKTFKLKAYIDQVTCSRQCSGIYRKQVGISKMVAQKAKETVKARYGVDNAASVSKPTESKVCPLCNKEFIPDTFRQVYCKDKHYGPCPVCGKSVEIKQIYLGPQCCSEECRIKRIESTCLDKYGNICVLNSDYGLKLRAETCMEKYGVDNYNKTFEFKERVKATMIERYGVESPLQSPEILAKVRATNMERYGGASPTCDPDVAQKSKDTTIAKYGGIGMGSPTVSAKIRKTNLERYGTESVLSSPQIRKRIKATLLKRYGVDTVAAIPGVLEKQKRTRFKKYGVEHIWQNPEILHAVQEHAAQTMLERYGVTNAFHSPELKQKASDTFMERYNVPWYVLTEDCSSSVAHNRISKINQAFSDFLSESNIEHELEYYMHGKAYDVRAGNTLLEINPTITHNSHMCIFNSQPPKDAFYHLNKTKMANDNGFRCIHVFAWDDWNSIRNLLSDKKSVYARNCVLEQVSERDANLFTDKYHIQGACRGQKLNYGLYLDGELIQVMTFGKPRYNKHYDYELLRLCSRADVRVIGGASKLFTAFKRDNNTCSVISYCDISKFLGNVYTSIGMRLKETTKPAKIWSKDDKYITDNLLRQRGYDQLFKTDFGKGISNEELMLKNGWLPVYDCGQAVYIWDSMDNQI